MSEIPFSQTNNKEFKNIPANTLQQPLQIIKKSNKEMKDLMANFKQVNDLLDPYENLTSCDYYGLIVIIQRNLSDFAKSTDPKFCKLQEAIWLTVINKIFQFPTHLDPFGQENYLYEVSSANLNYATQK